MLDKNKIDTVVYHGGCHDGMTASACVYLYYQEKGLPQPTYIPYSHGQKGPSFKGKNVLIVDFSFKKDVMERLIGETEGKIMVLDHHETAREDMISIPDEYKIFDMTRCGAVMTALYLWDEIDEKVSEFLKLIEGRDLWKQDEKDRWLPFSLSLQMELKQNDIPHLASLIKNISLDSLITKGIVIRDYQMSLLNTLLKRSSFIMAKDPLDEAKHIFYAQVNSNILQSEVGDIVLETYPWIDFVVIFNIDNEMTRFSLRSRGNYNTSSLLKTLTYGGGHPSSAGGARPGAHNGLGLPNLAPYVLGELARGKDVMTLCEGRHILEERFPGKVTFGRSIFLSETELNAIEAGTLKTHIVRGSKDWGRIEINYTLSCHSLDKKPRFTRPVLKVEKISYDDLLTGDLSRFQLLDKSSEELMARLKTYWKEEEMRAHGLLLLSV